jgi:hypothetical protein
MPKFLHDFLPRVESVLHRDGIYWGGYRFNGSMLHSIPIGKMVSYRVDRQNNSRILLSMPDKQLVEVPRVTPAHYLNHDFERQLRICQAAKCNAPEIVKRRQLASEAKTETVRKAKEQTQLVQQQLAAVTGSDSPIALPSTVAPMVDMTSRTTTKVAPSGKKYSGHSGSVVRPVELPALSRLK